METTGQWSSSSFRCKGEEGSTSLVSSDQDLQSVGNDRDREEAVERTCIEFFLFPLSTCK